MDSGFFLAALYPADSGFIPRGHQCLFVVGNRYTDRGLRDRWVPDHDYRLSGDLAVRRGFSLDSYRNIKCL